MNQQHTVIIAEAGVNHCGDIDLALKLVDEAADAGVDYVKFQTFNPSRLVTGKALMADYQSKNTGSRGGQLEMLEKLRLSKEDHFTIMDRCTKRGIKFLSTPFDDESTAFLATLGLDYWKIPSGEVNNVPYLEQIASYGGHVLMSTGMCGMEEIRQAVDCLKKAGTPEITLLHCNTEYPTPMEDVNLKAMITMEKEFCLPVGYSDHTRGIEIPVAAAALGACVLEKHFTLDRGMEGPDHQASLEPEELKAMVTAVRNVEEALGSGKKEPSQSEQKNRAVARKSIVAKCRIKKGERFSEENLTVKRPGTGISPMRWPELMGQTADRDYAEDELIGKDIL